MRSNVAVGAVCPREHYLCNIGYASIDRHDLLFIYFASLLTTRLTRLKMNDEENTRQLVYLQAHLWHQEILMTVFGTYFFFALASFVINGLTV